MASIMCSYNEVNGVPSCANDLFQNNVVRNQWGFEGFIVSGCGAAFSATVKLIIEPTQDATLAAHNKEQSVHMHVL